MGVIRTSEIPVAFEDAGTVVRTTEAGDMTVELDTLQPNLDMDDMFKGLPDDCCQAEHWGYVIEGEIQYRMHDGEDVVAQAGDAYYVPPGHLPHSGSDGARVVEFSKTDDLQKTLDVIDRNMAALGS